MCLNYAGTTRWAAVPGSLHGAKQPLFLAILIVTIVLAVLPWPRERSPMGPLARAIGWTAFGSLCIFFFIWFPPRSWMQIPVLDNWPARYLSTLQGIDLVRRGAVTGWHWHYLGGYHLSSDITQSLTVLSLVPYPTRARAGISSAAPGVVPHTAAAGDVGSIVGGSRDPLLRTRGDDAWNGKPVGTSS